MLPRFDFAATCVLALAVAPLAAQPGPTVSRAPYDVVITGGTVVDGSGIAPRAGDTRQDLGIRDGRITRLAPSGTLQDSGTVVIRADGRIVSPGFIDLHAHAGTDILTYPLAENFVRQGITTTFASLHSQALPWPLAPHLASLTSAINVGYFAGHTWTRSRVMGLANRAPTAAELAQMVSLVDSAMRVGAFGLATGLEYIPAAYATTDEVIALARAARGGVYMTHLRDEGPGVFTSVREALQIGQSAGLPVHINHLKVTGAANFGRSVALLALIDSARASGADLSFDVYPYTAFSTYSDVLLPPWALAGGDSAYRARLANPVLRRRIREEARAIFPIQAGRGPASIRIRDAASAPQYAGRTLADILRQQRKPVTIAAAVDLVMDLQASGGFTGVFDAMDASDVARLMQHPAASVTSDGDLVGLGVGHPHPRSYGAFPRVLADYVRESRTLSLPRAIAMMTSGPAKRMGLTDRGTLAVGYVADVTIFDADRIRDAATYTDPHHFAIGVTDVLVAGVPVLRQGTLTGARPGRALTRNSSSAD